MDINELDKSYIEGFVKKCASVNANPVIIAKQAGFDRLADGKIFEYISKCATTQPGLSSGSSKGTGMNRLFGAEGKATDVALTGKRSTTPGGGNAKYIPAEDPEGNVMTGFIPGKPGVPITPEYQMQVAQQQQGAK